VLGQPLGAVHLPASTLRQSTLLCALIPKPKISSSGLLMTTGGNLPSPRLITSPFLPRKGGGLLGHLPLSGLLLALIRRTRRRFTRSVLRQGLRGLEDDQEETE
jgi:hypothetical protein